VRDNDIYCFEPGQEVIETCNEEIPNPGTGMETKPTPGMESKSTPGMIPATFMPSATNMPINPSEVKCGMRRTGTDCLKDDRIVNGQEAECNEWPWQVGLVARQGDLVSLNPGCGGTLINSK